MAEMTLGQALNEALWLQKAGRLAEAESIHRRILDRDPDQPDGLRQSR